jgi:8-oxo-dGTP pyrophosphatase MutT (NUDIX family)
MDDSTEPRWHSSGTWGDEVEWDFYVADRLPDPGATTAAFCVALCRGCLVLTKTIRNRWELLGGHVEAGETPDDAVVREAMEEGGVTLERWSLFGYREVRPRPGMVNKATGLPYPVVGYIAYYVATSDRSFVEPTGEEVAGRLLVAIGDLARLDALGVADANIVAVGLSRLGVFCGEEAATGPARNASGTGPRQGQ